MVSPVPLKALWIPILVSAVLVFLASSISHAVLRLHRWDFRGLPAEGDVLDVLRRAAVPPGDYFFPYAPTPKDVRDPGLQEKWNRGPVGVLTVMRAGGNPMGRTFALWFLYCVVVEIFTAFLVGRALPAGAAARAVFVLAAVAAFGGHALALWQGSIWYGRDVGATLRFTADALAYGLLTGAAFSWLWSR